MAAASPSLASAEAGASSPAASAGAAASPSFPSPPSLSSVPAAAGVSPSGAAPSAASFSSSGSFASGSSFFSSFLGGFGLGLLMTDLALSTRLRRVCPRSSVVSTGSWFFSTFACASNLPNSHSSASAHAPRTVSFSSSVMCENFSFTTSPTSHFLYSSRLAFNVATHASRFRASDCRNAACAPFLLKSESFSTYTLLTQS
mmetsp:Transcript_82590/g.165051  ORF Transcript_82590/g.165051 Transcript_82590/m.165051 type:complete len:201 (+) Transcript_82590:307-909(+)